MIQRVFKVTLSQETLRPLLGELKRKRVSATSAGVDAEETAAEGLPQASPNAADNQGVSSNDAEDPDFEIRVRPQKHDPDMFYVNKYMKQIEADLFS